MEGIEAKSSRGTLGKVSTASIVKLLTLHILLTNKKPLCGVEIKDKLNEILGPSTWRPSNDLLYNKVLKSLDSNGLILGTKQDPSRKGWNKVFYQITDKGCRLMEADKAALKPALLDFKIVVDAMLKYVFDNRI